MDALIRNLLAAFKVGIDELVWMSPATKREAQAKLAKFRVKIAYPDQWRDFSALEIKPGDHVGNQMRFRAFQSTESWARLGKPVERWRWGFTPQTVNASYSSTNNEITFPAASCSHRSSAPTPIERSITARSAGSSATSSRTASTTRAASRRRGTLRDWWTAGDAETFEAARPRVGAQLFANSPLPGVNINPRPDDGREHRRSQRRGARLSRLPHLAPRQAGAGARG